MQLNIYAYKAYKKLKAKFEPVVVRITETDITFTGVHLAFKNHREYLAHRFKQLGVEVYRWSHNYDSLGGDNPELGLVYLGSDSVIDEAIEVHALIGHNARYVEATRNPL